MVAATQQIYEAFESLSIAEKREVTSELLRRVGPGFYEIPDEAFTEMANELFMALDREEEQNDRASAG